MSSMHSSGGSIDRESLVWGFMVTYRLSWWHPGIDRRPEMRASSRLVRVSKGKRWAQPQFAEGTLVPASSTPSSERLIRCKGVLRLLFTPALRVYCVRSALGSYYRPGTIDEPVKLLLG